MSNVFNDAENMRQTGLLSLKVETVRRFEAPSGHAYLRRREARRASRVRVHNSLGDRTTQLTGIRPTEADHHSSEADFFVIHFPVLGLADESLPR